MSRNLEITYKKIQWMFEQSKKYVAWAEENCQQNPNYEMISYWADKINKRIYKIYQLVKETGQMLEPVNIEVTDQDYMFCLAMNLYLDQDVCFEMMNVPIPKS